MSLNLPTWTLIARFHQTQRSVYSLGRTQGVRPYIWNGTRFRGTGYKFTASECTDYTWKNP